jgi:iron(III) transport system substrate-binding protein
MRNYTITTLLKPFWLFLVCLVTNLGALPQAAAFEVEFEKTYGAVDALSTVHILSSTDSERFKPVIAGFLQRNPTISVRYVTASTSQIYKAIADEKAPFDLVISSAMDLQMKLANDGATHTVQSAETATVPDWARWRTNVFGFALEPVTLLISKRDFVNLTLPKTRRDLLALMRDNPSIFNGRIATYDPYLSGAGYLFSTQDSRQSETFWRLAEVMGRLNAKLYCCTSQMIDAVNNGEMAVAYNVLGSYANATLPPDSNAQIITFEDYTQILLRTAIVPKTTRNFENGVRFLDFLVSPEGQLILDNEAKLPSLQNTQINQLVNKKPIRLSSGLLVFLDQLKKNRFLREWDAALIQN